MKSIKYNDKRLNAKTLVSMCVLNGDLHQTYYVEGELYHFVNGELKD